MGDAIGHEIHPIRKDAAHNDGTVPLEGGDVFYAALHTMTRRMGETEGAVTMSVYIQTTFILVSIVFGLAFGDGRFGDQDDPALRFLLRAWGQPPASDTIFFILLGISVAGAGVLISQAYRVAQAAFVAPFEYLALPLAVLWGMLIFDEWPDTSAYLGMSLILIAGAVTIWREAIHSRPTGPDRQSG
ncbi:MAG: DMT family transporter [Pseudomonadota bacterium]